MITGFIILVCGPMLAVGVGIAIRMALDWVAFAVYARALKAESSVSSAIVEAWSSDDVFFTLAKADVARSRKDADKWWSVVSVLDRIGLRGWGCLHSASVCAIL